MIAVFVYFLFWLQELMFCFFFAPKFSGLPSQHFSYVKNVHPGLPLFLFNYSDKKLHGIFEAASTGQMNINPYGWTTDGAERTLYPAQVLYEVMSDMVLLFLSSVIMIEACLVLFKKDSSSNCMMFYHEGSDPCPATMPTAI